MKPSLLRWLLLPLLPLAAARGSPAVISQVGPDKVVIANAQHQAVTVQFSNDRAIWRAESFAARSTRETAYAEHVRIVSQDNQGKPALYEDTISPAGKYSIIREDGGRLVLRTGLAGGDTIRGELPLDHP